MNNLNNTAAFTQLVEAVDHWLEGSEADLPSANRLCLPALVLAQTDPHRCRALIDRVLARQNRAGLIINHSTVRAGQDNGQAAWPLWGTVVEASHNAFPSTEWLRLVWPALRKAFSAAVRHFDPDRCGLPHWRMPEEAWDRMAYRDRLATPELPTLLLCEADALRRIHTHLGFRDADRHLTEELEQISSGLLDFMANSDRGYFDARVVGGARVQVSPRLSVFPLLWKGLPANLVGPLLLRAQAVLVDGIRQTDALSVSLETALWRIHLQRLGALTLLSELNLAVDRPRNGTRGPVPERIADLLSETCAGPAVKGRFDWCIFTLRRLVAAGNGRNLAALVCLSLAVAWGLSVREPALDAVSLSVLRQESAVAVAMGDFAKADQVEAVLESAGVANDFIDWIKIRRAENASSWPDAAALYEVIRMQDGDSPPVLFGAARAHGRSRRPVESRKNWQAFIEQHGSDFPAAAVAARAEWWQNEKLWSDQAVAQAQGDMIE